MPETSRDKPGVVTEGTPVALLSKADMVSPVPSRMSHARIPPDHRRPGRHRGHSARYAGTALLHRISTEPSTETAPHSGLVSETATQVSNEATVASATELETIRQGHHVAASTPVAVDDAQPVDATTASFPVRDLPLPRHAHDARRVNMHRRRHRPAKVCNVAGQRDLKRKRRNAAHERFPQ